jgi:hypothetical protein
MNAFFRVLLKIKPLKMQGKGVPKPVVEDEILTGYLGERMHRNLLRINKIRKHL